MRYYMHIHNIRYELIKRLDRFYLRLTDFMPARLRMWIVVSATIHARRMYPSPGYDGPDGLTYQQIYDGSLRGKSV